MLPALTPTQTVSGSDGRRSASPDSRIQWHRYVASPPSTSRTSASRTQGTHRSLSMLGSAVSSRTPTDFQPRSPWVTLPTGDELPCRGGRAHGVAVLRRRDAQGTGVRYRLAQQVDQRIADACVRDAPGREKKPHACLLYVAVMTLLESRGDPVHGKTDYAIAKLIARCDPSPKGKGTTTSYRSGPTAKGT